MTYRTFIRQTLMFGQYTPVTITRVGPDLPFVPQAGIVVDGQKWQNVSWNSAEGRFDVYLGECHCGDQFKLLECYEAGGWALPGDIEAIKEEGKQVQRQIEEMHRNPPDYPESEEIGVLRCLRSETRPDSFRCHECGTVNRGTIVWVPDSVKMGDSGESITEAARQGRWNGNNSGWCQECAAKLGKPAKRGMFR